MSKRPNYKECASTLKGYLCRKYGGYKRDPNKQCVGCPASGEVCYMIEILKTLERRRGKNDRSTEEKIIDTYNRYNSKAMEDDKNKALWNQLIGFIGLGDM